MASAYTKTVTVSSKGWVVIPAPIRKKISLKPGMKVTVQEVEGKIILEPQADDIVESLFGKLAGKSSLTRALLEDRAEEIEREKKEIYSR
ncbi:MAG: AbrB/MazE/SpoVT family DNA-binding domain-containing protein [Desulfosalsimonas sp.]|uniref:AbrB/MazE/SpoVT family DNA-binding domain-containing protein n=1 Tax=Desulfosalsimonas sp. TaxID=3073848 RepID=UPI0039707782